MGKNSDFDEKKVAVITEMLDMTRLEVLVSLEQDPKKFTNLLMTFDEAKKAFLMFPSGSEWSPYILKRWLQLCVSLSDAARVFAIAKERSCGEAMAMERWEELYGLEVRGVSDCLDAKLFISLPP